LRVINQFELVHRFVAWSYRPRTTRSGNPEIFALWWNNEVRTITLSEGRMPLAAGRSWP